MRSLFAIVIGATVVSSASATVLYDAAGNSDPMSQGWYYLTNPPIHLPPVFVRDTVAGMAGNLLKVNSTVDLSESAGIFSTNPLNTAQKHPGVGTLDRALGFTLGFGLQILNEDHLTDDRNGDTIDDRGGYSVIVLTDDHKGIELAFWDTQVFAYDYADLGGGNMEFVHAESSSGFNPTAALYDYGLTLLGNSYSLTANGNVILSGLLRDYSAEAVSGTPTEIYGYTNFLFFGDDTSKAGSATAMSYINLTAIPEPATLGLLGLAGLASLRRRK